MNPRVPLGLLEGFRGEKNKQNKTTVNASTMNELLCGFKLLLNLFIDINYNLTAVLCNLKMPPAFRSKNIIEPVM